MTSHQVADSAEQYLRNLTKSFTGLEKPLKDAKTPTTMTELIAELHEVFESDRVDIEYVNHLLISYQSNGADWKKFAKFDRFRYTRNLVDAGNGKFNLMIICWGEGHGSAIHDHADSHCFMKMLKGELREIRYAWPDEDDTNNNSGQMDRSADISAPMNGEAVMYNGNELHELSRCIMETNSVHYINDTLGLHLVENPSHTDGAVSLHLYCPPYDSCSIFNQKTGKQTKCRVEFYSKFGQRRCKDATKVAEDN